jgi:hypothetical protein
MLFQSDREFKFWDYNVSHKQMLVRSPRTPDLSSNIDVVFWGVEFVEIATALIGVEIELATHAQLAAIAARCKDIANRGNVYVVSSENKQYGVVAAGFKVLQNTLDIFDSTLLYFGRDRPSEEYGTVLAHS